MAPHDDASRQRTALVLYGSETGNAQDIAEELGRCSERLHFDTVVTDLNSASLPQLLQFTLIIIVISTTGQGDLPRNADAFWRRLRSVRLRPGCLKPLRFISFGLGDSSYPKFNWAHRKLRNRLVQLGAQCLGDSGEGDAQHPEGVDGSFVPWCHNLRATLLHHFPLESGLEPIPDHALLQPKWILEHVTVSESFDDQENPSQWTEKPKESERHHENENCFPKFGQSLLDSRPTPHLLPIEDAITVNLTDSVRVTPESHWQDVRHLQFSTTASVSYDPGALVTVHPQNFADDVDGFISLMGWSRSADKPVHFVQNLQSGTRTTSSPLPLRHLLPFPNLTLRSLLTNYLDIMSIPRRSFFSLIANFTQNDFHRERLLEFTSPDHLDELYDYTTRPRRSIFEVLQEFDTVKIPWQWAAHVLPPIRPRQFSIASGGRLKATKAGETRFELLVAIVKYRTVIKRLRQGLCTRYLASLKPGQKLNVTIQTGGLNISPGEMSKPAVMIGPGTGIAPLRSLIHEKLAEGNAVDTATRVESSGLLADCALFFGCRNRSADFFFCEEWQKLGLEHGLRTYFAFSRDQIEKVYVQDLIRKQAASVYDILYSQTGTCYVCGSSGKMPQAVREAIIEVFEATGGKDREEAERFLLQMEKDGRYKQETW